RAANRRGGGGGRGPEKGGPRGAQGHPGGQARVPPPIDARATASGEARAPRRGVAPAAAPRRASRGRREPTSRGGIDFHPAGRPVRLAFSTIPATRSPARYIETRHPEAKFPRGDALTRCVLPRGAEARELLAIAE